MLRRVLGPLMRRWRWLDVAVRVNERAAELHGPYVAAAVTLTAFLSLFPLLLVGVAVLGYVSANSADLASDVVSRLGLSGEASTTVTDAIARAEDTRRAATIIGLGGLLWSGLALVAALQFAFNSTWQVEGRGIRDKLVGLLWLAGATVILLTSFGVTAAVNVLPGPAKPAALVVGVGVNFALWLWSMKVLPNRDVGWRALVPGALAGAAGLEVLKVIGAVYVPRLVASSSALYGSLGMMFAILAWLLFFGRLLVYVSTLNVVLWEDRHGTVKSTIEVPRVPDQRPAPEMTRSGDVRRVS